MSMITKQKKKKREKYYRHKTGYRTNIAYGYTDQLRFCFLSVRTQLTNSYDKVGHRLDTRIRDSNRGEYDKQNLDGM